MIVQVNGESMEVPENSNVRDLVERLRLRGPVAVELNAAVIKRDNHAEQPLRDGDVLEIVTLVGGG